MGFFLKIGNSQDDGQKQSTWTIGWGLFIIFVSALVAVIVIWGTMHPAQ